jgi:hypothetical protein
MPGMNGTMTERQNTTSNSRVQRKQLSDQLDRFDQMSDRLDKIIDVLAEGLPNAVKDACQEGARQAVKDAIVEIFTNPDFRPLFAKMQPEPMPVASVPVIVQASPPKPRKPNHWDRLKAKLAAVREGAKGLVSKMKNAVLSRFNPVRHFVARISLAAGEQLHVRRMILTALCVGTIIGMACWLLPDTVVAFVSGFCGASTAVLVQIAAWLKRAAGRCGLTT